MLKLSLVLIVVGLNLNLRLSAFAQPAVIDPKVNVEQLPTESRPSTQAAAAWQQQCFTSTDVQNLDACQCWLRQTPSDLVAWNQLGQIYYGSGHYEAAYRIFQHIIAVDTDDAIAWSNVCAALSQLNDYQQALSACDTALAMNLMAKDAAAQIVTLNNKAIALYFLGRYPEALNVLESALALDPNDSQARLNSFVVAALLHTQTQQDSLYR
ncbi:MAG: tetratricopeptide repeat protein [Cyanobacteria bacterium P01_H01_bin.121]